MRKKPVKCTWRRTHSLMILVSQHEACDGAIVCKRMPRTLALIVSTIIINSAVLVIVLSGYLGNRLCVSNRLCWLIAMLVMLVTGYVGYVGKVLLLITLTTTISKTHKANPCDASLWEACNIAQLDKQLRDGQPLQFLSSLLSLEILRAPHVGQSHFIGCWTIGRR